jgi:Sulfotransferase family
MLSDRVKVLYIAGSGRSGSTVLDNILGQIDGFCSVGELRYIWERGLIEDRLCGCGERVHECPFWRAALTEAFGAPDAVDPLRMMRLQQLGTRVRHVPQMIRGAAGRTLVAKMGEYPATMGQLYRGIHTASGCRVIVDSSKLPAYGHVVSHLPEVDLYVVHLVRDPRATAYSWLRKKAAPDRKEGMMQRQRPLHAAALWTVWNWTTERLWGADPSRYLLVRYEDFVRMPRSVVERIVSFLGEKTDELPFVDDTTVRLAPTHTVAGNPSRFKTGDVALRPDDEWTRKMDLAQRLVVTTVAGPLLGRYGYPRRLPAERRAVSERRPPD